VLCAQCHSNCGAIDSKFVLSALGRVYNSTLMAASQF
jgi:hypothetical protein